MAGIQTIHDWLHVDCGHCTQAWESDLAHKQLAEFPHWALAFDASGTKPQVLWRVYRFHNFEGVKMAVHAIMHLADDEDHHPEVQFAYREVKVSWNTHSAGGVSDNDWACAAKCDDALKHIG